MAFKSHAHRDKFKELLNQKKITQKQYDEMAQGTPPDHRLPKRLHPKK